MLRAQLDVVAPRFWVPPGAINVLHTPDEFYRHLLARISTAKRRVFLASLYVGAQEHELVAALDRRLIANPELQVSILADALRGTREAPHAASSASLLAPLVARHPERVRIHLYETPRMSRLLRLVLPKRLNEGVGLQHMKLYGFDDEIVLSGANLSRDYFTNRQDRYFSVGSAAVTSHFWRIFNTVASLSYSMHAVEPGGFGGFRLDPPAHSGYSRASRELSALLRPVNKPETLSKSLNDADAKEPTDNAVSAMANASNDVDTNGSVSANGDGDSTANGTWVYPVCEFAPFGVGNELKALGKVTDQVALGKTDWMLTAGYFNIVPALRKRLLQSKASHALVVTASEEANGFHASRGLSGKVPALYTELTRQFAAQARPKGISVKEWQRGIVNKPGGWSYHAKGLWLYRENPPAHPHTSEGDDSTFDVSYDVTYIGSSNFTKRSYTHDLEAGAVLVTQDPALRAALAAERAHLCTYAQRDARDQRPTLLTMLATRALATRL